jgi:hypothetical protein
MNRGMRKKMEKKTSVVGLGYFTETLSLNDKENLCLVNNLYDLYKNLS